jgi:anti-anti-sigma factor
LIEIVRYSFGGVPLLSLAGDFDHDSVTSYAEEAEEALGKGGSRLLLQLTDCPYIDSGGVGCILSSLHRVRHEGWLGVIDPNPDVLRLLQIVGLTIDPNFRVFSGLDDVQTYLQGPVTN